MNRWQVLSPDPALASRRRRRKDRNLRGFKPPIHCHHCSAKITGWVNWINRNPYCGYCYGFRAVLLEREKHDKMDERTREELKKQVLSGERP